MTNKINPEIRKKIYAMWYHIKERCYQTSHERYHLYGGKGVTLCERWLDFRSFLEDIPKVQGHNESLLLEGKIHLDKDSLNMDNKIYSIENCVFVSIEINNKFKPNQMIPFRGISPDGEIFESFNQSEFSKMHNLSQAKISNCLKGKQKKTKGWSFEYLK